MEGLNGVQYNHRTLVCNEGETAGPQGRPATADLFPRYTTSARHALP